MEFYKIDEVNTHRYFKTPKELFHNKCYRVNLSTDAKLVYSILLDRMELSRKNGWINENKEIYLLYTKEDIAEIMGVSITTAYRAFKQLESLELIKQVRQGLNKPNKIFIGKIKWGFVWTCQICKSGPIKCTCTDLSNLNTNETEYSETDLSETEKYNGVLQGQDPNILFPPDRPPKDINNEEIILDTVKRLLVKENHPEYFVDYEIVLNHYFQRYKERTGKQHPPLTKQSCSRIVDTLFKAYDEGYSIDLDLDYGDLLDMIDKHFETKYKHTDWNIMHFLSDGVKVRRMFEVAY